MGFVNGFGWPIFWPMIGHAPLATTGHFSVDRWTWKGWNVGDSSRNMTPRLFLAEDDLSVRQMLAFFLRKACHCEVAGEAGDAEAALPLCESLRPTAVLCDLRLPGLDGVGLLREIRRRQLAIPVIFYTGAMHEGYLLEAMRADPEGFVLKCDDLAVLRQAVHAVSSGATFWSPKVAALRQKGQSASRPIEQLTEAEIAVLRLVGAHKSSKEIAAILHKAEVTVAHQRQSIMDKLNVHSASGLVELARQAGLAE
jgi:DNA-binding NarL/FixJ family response regulator